MRPLVLNVAIGPDLHHAEIPFGTVQADDLRNQDLMCTAVRFLSEPACAITEPRLRCDSAGWHDVLQALTRRRREDLAAAGTPISDRQALADRALLIMKAGHLVARFDAGLLPEVEIAAVARRELFDSLEGFQKLSGNWRIKASELPHRPGCVAAKTAPGTYETRPRAEDTLSAWHLACLKPLRSMVKCIGMTRLVGVPVERATIEILDHVGWCALCRAGEVAQPTVKVTVEWNERTLVREYVL